MKQRLKKHEDELREYLSELAVKEEELAKMGATNKGPAEELDKKFKK